ncbi:MAG: efflux RND transporter periplasmic adaptor subunit [Candidatus Binatia bacterium]
MKKRIILFALILLVAAGFVFYLIKNQKTAQKGDIRVSGTIELTEVDCAFKISGLIEELRLDEGDSVKEGDLIARLDDRELRDRRNKAEASLQTEESRVRQLLIAIEREEKNSRGFIAQARANLAATQARLRELLAGSRRQEIKEARAEMDRARSELQKVTLEWKRAQRLFAAQTISKREWDTAKMAFEMARAQYERARERYDLVKEGPRKETIEAARSKEAEARASLQIAEATTLKVEELKQELQTTEASVKAARAELDLAETLMGETGLYAPISGMVLSKNMERGEIALPGSSVLTLGNLKKVWLRAYINETNLGRIKLGQPVEVFTDTYPGRAYPGRIAFISDKAEFTPKQIQTQEERVKLVYRIKIDIDNPLMELKSGMPADARIITENASGPQGG